MLTWSTSALASLPTLSSRLPSCSQALFARTRLAAVTCLQHSRSYCLQSVLKERTGPDGLDVSATSSCPRSRSALFVSGTPRLGRLPTLSGMPADQNAILHPVDTHSTSDAPDRQQLGSVSSLSALGTTEIKWTARRRRTLLWLMLTAKSAERAWPAYQELLSYRAAIPHHSLHRLARLLASIKPRTRTIHLQLLSVLKTLQGNHGQLRLWEWNTLIDSAGKQWRKTRLEDYENALDIFNKKGALPVAHTVSTDEVVNPASDPCATRQDPDIWTYNILLSIASRSNLPPAVRHASSLLRSSCLSPNRYTHLCLLRYFAIRNDLHSVRSTLDKMKQQGLELGLDGINACLWAYARNRRLDVALPMYRVLRSNVEPLPCADDDKVREDARYVRNTVGLDIPDGLAPDAITYTTMIQSLAYHGDLKNALGVFVDMLSTPNREADGGDTGACYRPSMAAFRGLFLGFARHGRDSEHRTTEAEAEPVVALFPSVRGNWDLETLETVFAAFLQLPSHPKPTPRVVYWILVAFDKTSGRDNAKLCEVWEALEAKYGGGWGGRLEDMRLSIFGLVGDSVKIRESHDG